MSRAFALALLLVGVAAYSVFGVWTWRRLWRPATDAYSRTVYGFGVKRFGLVGWVAWSAVFTITSSTGDLHPILRLAVNAFIAFPLMLWGGYVWGRAMAGFFGQSRGI